MKKVLYLHGLETKSGGEKVDFLADKCYIHAPSIDYSRNDIFPLLIKIIKDYEPDLIIGSSMGGYVAYVLGGLYKIPIIAFNPAIHSRTFSPKFPNFTKKITPPNGKIILGKEDTVINPQKTINFLNNPPQNNTTQLSIEIVEGLGHRIPLNTFISKIKSEL